MLPRKWFNWFLTPALFLMVLGGCTDGKNQALDTVLKLNSSHIQKLTTCYTMFYAFKNSKGPKSKEELISFINDDENIDIQLERIGLDRQDFEQCFDGSDGEPLQVFYGVSAPSGPNQERPIIFEAVSGESYRVGFSDGTTKDVDQDEYDRLLELATKK